MLLNLWGVDIINLEAEWGWGGGGAVSNSVHCIKWLQSSIFWPTKLLFVVFFLLYIMHNNNYEVMYQVTMTPSSFLIPQISSACPQVWHEPDWFIGGTSAWSLACSYWKKTSEVNRCGTVNCYWPFRGTVYLFVYSVYCNSEIQLHLNRRIKSCYLQVWRIQL